MVDLEAMKLPQKYLQLLRRGEYNLLEVVLADTRLTIVRASNSTTICVMPSWAASNSPSLKAQHLAVNLVATPIFLI